MLSGSVDILIKCRETIKSFPMLVQLVLSIVKKPKIQCHNLKVCHPISIVEVHPSAVIGSRLSPKDMEYMY